MKNSKGSVRYSELKWSKNSFLFDCRVSENSADLLNIDKESQRYLCSIGSLILFN
ncbi:hypothetical protein MM221_08980 [Salipaludibacillus sp. LMS25]|uniref:hypothetical protein n=1 Tax=Salipaludibacillus sp. LMS25 TaxID=2924031 RepID=UPI0020D002DB|nr:hypothetical protein [Salipaludibacillus sp. LMS25]UTR16636.1 hypothetical protein MM221_08980 [Salipaludibacillus sp. LMS25]